MWTYVSAVDKCTVADRRFAARKMRRVSKTALRPSNIRKKLLADQLSLLRLNSVLADKFRVCYKSIALLVLLYK